MSSRRATRSGGSPNDSCAAPTRSARNRSRSTSGGGWGGAQKTPAKRVQLYHLGDDPAESKNLEAAEPEKVQELVADLARAAPHDPTWDELTGILAHHTHRLDRLDLLVSDFHEQLARRPRDAKLAAEFGLALFDLLPADVEAAFPELAPAQLGCRFADCRHASEPGCEAHPAVAAGRLHAARLDSYARIMASLDAD